MHTDPSLNTEIENCFAADGFVLLPGFVAGDKLAEIIEHVDRFIRDVVPTMPAERVFYENKHDPGTLKQIQHMGLHDAWFHDLLTAGPFPDTAAELLGAAAVPKNLQYFNKPAGLSKPTPPHQDGFYFMLDPCQAVTMWLALDDVDEENGCVRYVRGSHRNGMRQHARTQTLGFSQGIVDYPTEADRSNEVSLPAKPGDLLVHHALTIHRADANRSTNRSRRALGWIYYSQHAREDTDAHAAYQERLAAELKATGQI